MIGPLTLEAAFYSIFFFSNFRFNRALISRSGAMLRHRNFQSVIGPLTLEAAFYLIFFFSNFRFNRVLISRSSALVRTRNFQIVIGPLNRGSTL